MEEQREQQPPKKKGGALKWTGIGCGGLLLLIILMGACTIMIMPSGEGESGSAAGTGTEEETEEEATEEEVPEDQTYSVGETADIDGKQITVNDVEKRQPGEFDSLQEGYEFVVISLDISNESNEEISYNPLDFDFIDGNGNIQDSFGSLSLDGVEEQLSSGGLAPGGKTSGTVVYEAEIGDDDLTLRYSDNMFSDDTIDFNLY